MKCQTLKLENKTISQQKRITASASQNNSNLCTIPGAGHLQSMITIDMSYNTIGLEFITLLLCKL